MGLEVGFHAPAPQYRGASGDGHGITTAREVLFRKYVYCRSVQPCALTVGLHRSENLNILLQADFVGMCAHPPVVRLASHGAPVALGKLKRGWLRNHSLVFEIGRAHVWNPVTNAHLVC